MAMAKKRNERPGLMFWFDDWRPLLKLDDQTLSELFRACILYACEGMKPAFSGTVAIVWEMLIPKLDRDAERYAARSRSGEYAVFCREERKAGREPLSFETWLESNQRPLTTAIGEQRSIPGVNDDIQLQQHLQLQQQSQRQQQKGRVQGEGIYRPPSEQEFEKLREQRLEMLGEKRN